MYKKYSKIQSVLNNLGDIKSIIKLIPILPLYLKRKIELKEISEFVKKKEFKIEESLIISSETRSGSTWLMEMLLGSNIFIPNWEPLHPVIGVIPKNYDFGDRPYLEENNNNNDFKIIFKEIFELKKINFWNSSFVTIKDLDEKKMILTKTVRANMLLPWLTTNFKFKFPPILLYRHPIATIISQKNSFINKKKGQSTYLPPNCINNERYIENENYINVLETELERRVAIWCVNNVQTIDHKDFEIKWQVVYYENLFLNPEAELNKIYKSLKIDVKEKIIINYNKPSASTSKNLNKETKLKEWLNILTDKEKNAIQLVFNHFNLKMYSAFSPFPKKVH